MIRAARLSPISGTVITGVFSVCGFTVASNRARLVPGPALRPQKPHAVVLTPLGSLRSEPLWESLFISNPVKQGFYGNPSLSARLSLSGWLYPVLVFSFPGYDVAHIQRQLIKRITLAGETAFPPPDDFMFKY